MADKTKEITREIDRLLDKEAIKESDLMRPDKNSYKDCVMKYKVYKIICFKYNYKLYDYYNMIEEIVLDQMAILEKENEVMKKLLETLDKTYKKNEEEHKKNMRILNRKYED